MDDKDKKEATIKIEIIEKTGEGQWNYKDRTFHVEDRNSKEEWSKVIKEVVKYLEEAKEQDR